MRKARSKGSFTVHIAQNFACLILLCLIAILLKMNLSCFTLSTFALSQVLPSFGKEYYTLTESEELKETNNENETKETVSTEEIQVSQSDEKDTNEEISAPDVDFSSLDVGLLSDVSYLKKTLYTVDRKTELLDGDIRAEEFIAKDMTLDMSTEGPKILIFHTHSTEGFKDSDMSKDMNEGIWGAGERLKNVLEQKYGIEVLHDTGRYDIVDGKAQITGAYERMEPYVRKILEENPSIELVIDLHRDGVNDDVHLATDINGKKCAKIMFFNGMCRLYDNGVLTTLNNLENPNLSDNLALSFKLQLSANTLYPGLCRKIYLNAYRYSLHMKPKSLLIELGAQTNTKEEIYNSVDLLADILASVILK